MNTDYNKKVANNMKKIRTAKGMKQLEMAMILGIKESYYNEMENGKKNISLEKIIKLADEFTLPLDWFIDRNYDIEKKIKQ